MYRLKKKFIEEISSEVREEEWRLFQFTVCSRYQHFWSTLIEPLSRQWFCNLYNFFRLNFNQLLARRTIGRIVSLFQKQCIVIYVGFSLIGVVVAVFEIL